MLYLLENSSPGDLWESTILNHLFVCFFVYQSLYLTQIKYAQLEKKDFKVISLIINESNHYKTYCLSIATLKFSLASLPQLWEFFSVLCIFIIFIIPSLVWILRLIFINKQLNLWYPLSFLKVMCSVYCLHYYKVFTGYSYFFNIQDAWFISLC